MNQISTKEAAEKWGISVREVQRFLKAGRISGAKKYSGSWFIPENCLKPDDLRQKAHTSTEYDFVFYGMVDIKKEKNVQDYSELGNELQSLIEADFAYRRGDAKLAIDCWYRIQEDSKMKVEAATLATAAAISVGDYPLYYEIQYFLKQKMDDTTDHKQKAILALPGLLASVSMSVPELAPEWLVNCNFENYEKEVSPFLLFLYAMHLRNVKHNHGLLAVTKSVVTLCSKEKTFTWIDLYMLVLSALASYQTGDTIQAKKSLYKAMELGLPHGFILPFADYMGQFGGLVEECLMQKYPQYVEKARELWAQSFKNWMNIRNQFTKHHVTTILTAQEYQVAHLLRQDMTYAEAAKRMHLSMGRFKNIVQEIYSKLYINKRSMLSYFVL